MTGASRGRSDASAPARVVPLLRRSVLDQNGLVYDGAALKVAAGHELRSILCAVAFTGLEKRAHVQCERTRTINVSSLEPKLEVRAPETQCGRVLCWLQVADAVQSNSQYRTPSRGC